MNAGGCGDASAVPGTAAELFQLAALLMGDQIEAVKLVEEALASVEIDPCQDVATARRLARQQLLERALSRLHQQDPQSFASVAAPAGAAPLCVEDEDLSSAGISHMQLTAWLAGDGRHDLRDWLAALPAAQRAIFVQRAVLGQGNANTADQMQAASSTIEKGTACWTPESVGEVYRLALCSLANSLAHAPAVLAGAHTAIAGSASA